MDKEEKYIDIDKINNKDFWENGLNTLRKNLDAISKILDYDLDKISIVKPVTERKKISRFEYDLISLESALTLFLSNIYKDISEKILKEEIDAEAFNVINIIINGFVDIFTQFVTFYCNTVKKEHIALFMTKDLQEGRFIRNLRDDITRKMMIAEAMRKKKQIGKREYNQYA